MKENKLFDLSINKKEIDFIFNEFNVDISKVELVDTKLEKSVGMYKPSTPGFIYIDKEFLKSKPESYAHLTVIHELFHLLQFEYNISLSLDFKFYSARFYNKICSDLEWNEDALEIDARFFELYYLWKKNILNKNNLIAYGKHLFKYKITNRLEFCAFELENIEFKSIIIEMIESIKKEQRIDSSKNKFLIEKQY